ncbi:MAG TPA: type II toxin-antitoxin system VapC family toxin [Ilumatobacteraceae bacterium]|nr:type II toxin-antitoxin system VapC family toxin [Ilumatobacteraceae bacterium]
MKLLLDTHIFVWAATGDQRLPADAATLIVDPANTRTLSAASVWEMSIKAASGRRAEVALMLHDLDEALHDLQTGQLPIDIPAAVAAGRLDWEHRDPFDRMLAAQATLGGFSLLTVDRAFDHSGIPLALS